MNTSKQLAIKELHGCIRWNAEAMVKIEIEDQPVLSRSEVRKRLAYWLAKFRQAQVV
jgi:hypothetical protein